MIDRILAWPSRSRGELKNEVFFAFGRTKRFDDSPPHWVNCCAGIRGRWAATDCRLVRARAFHFASEVDARCPQRRLSTPAMRSHNHARIRIVTNKLGPQFCRR